MWFRIFDNIVERASREKKASFGLFILTSYMLQLLSSELQPLGQSRDPCPLDASTPRLNESLILAQNQRWRRA